MEEKHNFKSGKKSCIKCGLPKESHLDLEKPQVALEINIWFTKKLYKFKNWEEAKERGFYMVD